MTRTDAGKADEDALIDIYRATIRPLYAYVSRRVGGDAGLAEDLVQDTWMRALDSWPAGGIPNEPLAWLVRVARNTLVSHFRRMRPEPIDPATLDLEAAAFSPDAPDRAAIVGWGLARVRRARARLRKKLERILRPADKARGRAAGGGTEHARQTPTS